MLKGQLTQNQKYIFFLFPVVLIFHLDCFDVSCRVLELLAVEVSLLSRL